LVCHLVALRNEFLLKFCVKTEEKFMKKLLAVLAIVAMCGSIAQAGTGSCSSGSFSVSFSGASFVSGLGWSSGGSRTINFSGSCSGCNVGPIIYGWGTNPLVEYYIGRGGGSSAGSYSTSKGSYTLQVNSCNGPNITGSGSFSQYNCSGSNSSGQIMSEHYNGWSNLGKGTSYGGGYCIVMVENWSGGSGSASVSVPNSSFYSHWVGSGSANFTCGGGSTTTSTTTTTSGSSTSTTSGGGSGTIVVRARSTDGAGQIQLYANSSTIATWTLGTSYANYSANTSATACAVIFTNDTSGRDVQVDYVVIQGTTKQAENQSTNTGVYQNSKCGGSYSEWLNCNGYIGF
jgi:endo-1,4-beta-xylanase